MNLQKRINAFLELSEFFKSLEKDNYQGNNQIFEKYFPIFKALIETEHFKNSWFTPENIKYAILSISESITKEKIEFWLEKYKEKIEKNSPKKIGVILAGNIPLVGFHDFMSVLISGNIFVGKMSSKDNNLLKAVINFLVDIEPEFKNYIIIQENRLTDFERVIATGSNNTARYFNYYFGKYPNIIRKNRSSVAVITKNETRKDIELLSDDIFMYFGLGCRNVSKIFVPEGFKLDLFFEALYKNKELINHHSYANNYDYNRAIYLMNVEKFLDNGFFMLKENTGLSSPISVIYYEYYKDINKLAKYLKAQEDNLQCIVSQAELPDLKTVKYSQTQKPELWDYADNINTIEFLCS